MRVLRIDDYVRAAEWSLFQWWRLLQQRSLAKVWDPPEPLAVWVSLQAGAQRSFAVWLTVTWSFLGLLLCSRLCVCICCRSRGWKA